MEMKRFYLIKWVDGRVKFACKYKQDQGRPLEWDSNPTLAIEFREDELRDIKIPMTNTKWVPAEKDAAYYQALNKGGNGHRPPSTAIDIDYCPKCGFHIKGLALRREG